MRLLLTRHICNEMRPRLRAYSDHRVPKVRYNALRKIAGLLDKADGTVRGGTSFAMPSWDGEHLAVLREILMDALTDCAQMQIRRALVVRIEQLDDHLGISAVERLGRLP
jgi:hypothetical protein